MAFINRVKFLIFGKRGPVYDTDAAAVFSNIASVTTPLTTAQKNAANDFIVGLKADGLWDKLDSLRLNIGSTIAAYSFCWKKNVQMTAVNSPTWTATGTQYDGATNYFRDTISPSTATKMTSNDGAAFCFFDPNNYPNNATAFLGATNGSNFMVLTEAIVA